MAGWHHWLNGCESEWTPGVGDGQGGLACCDSWGRKESDTTERLNWRVLGRTGLFPKNGDEGLVSCLELKCVASVPLDAGILNLTEKFSPAVSRDHSSQSRLATRYFIWPLMCQSLKQSKSRAFRNKIFRNSRHVLEPNGQEQRAGAYAYTHTHTHTHTHTCANADTQPQRLAKVCWHLEPLLRARCLRSGHT